MNLVKDLEDVRDEEILVVDVRRAQQLLIRTHFILNPMPKQEELLDAAVRKILET